MAKLDARNVSLTICPRCKVNHAIIDKVFGILPCKPCQDRQSKLSKPGKIPEMVGNSIKEQRKQHFDDIHGAHRKGVPSKEYRDRWGVGAMKRQGFSDKEIKEAKPVWSDDKYYKD